MSDHRNGQDFETAEPDQSDSTLQPVRLLWRHKWLVALGVVAGCVMGALHYARTPPIFQSGAQILVVKKSPDALPLPGSGVRSNYEDHLSTHMSLIPSPVIVAEAVQSGKLGELKSFAGRGDPTGEIIGSLKVSRQMNGVSPTSILNLSYRGPSSQDCPVILSAVIASYQKFLNTKYKNVTDETTNLITKASDILEKKLNEREKDYARFTLENPSLWKGKDGVSGVQERLNGLEARRATLLLQEAEIQGRLDVMEKMIQEGKYSREELLTMVARTRAASSDTETAKANLAAEDRVTTLKMEEKKLLEDFGEDHPKVREVRSQLALIRELKQQKARGEDDDPQSEDPVKAHIQTLKLEMLSTRIAATSLGRVIDQELTKARPLRAIEKKDEEYRNDIARSQLLFDAIAKRLDEVSLLKNFAGGYETEMINAPGPGGKVYPSQTQIMGIAAFLGMLAGLGLAYLAELTDQSFRTPEEIRRRLGLPVVGHIPNFTEKEHVLQPAGAEGPQLDVSLCSFHRPKSSEAESYRAVRTALFFSSRARGTKVIQVTSPDMGDGKSTLTANLAISIAQADKKLLLIDGDFRRPRLHKLFGLSAEKGLASVIANEAELEDVILPTAVPGLSVIPAGPIPPNPAELLNMPRFQEAVAMLREKFDYVVIDTPPLLAVTDPCVVVPHVDEVLLIVRISKNARPHALRAKEILSTLGAQVLGVVVNGVGKEGRGGYGYSYNQYRYGYGYTYRYAHSYRSEEPAEPVGAANGGTMNGNGSHPPMEPPSGRKKGFLGWLLDR